MMSAGNALLFMCPRCNLLILNCSLFSLASIAALVLCTTCYGLMECTLFLCITRWLLSCWRQCTLGTFDFIRAELAHLEVDGPAFQWLEGYLPDRRRCPCEQRPIFAAVHSQPVGVTVNEYQLQSWVWRGRVEAFTTPRRSTLAQRSSLPTWFPVEVSITILDEIIKLMSRMIIIC